MSSNHQHHQRKWRKRKRRKLASISNINNSIMCGEEKISEEIIGENIIEISNNKSIKDNVINNQINMAARRKYQWRVITKAREMASAANGVESVMAITLMKYNVY